MKNKPTVSAVIVAAGSGTRMGGVSKPLIDLGGKTVLERVLDAVSAAETVDDIVLVCRKSNEIDTSVSRCKKPIKTVEGGATRTESVRNGAMAAKSDFLCFHDCARPFIKSEDIDRVVNAALSCGAASACAPEYNTVKYLDTNRKVLFTPERDRLIAVQTPQVLKRDDRMPRADCFSGKVRLLHRVRPAAQDLSGHKRVQILRISELHVYDHIRPQNLLPGGNLHARAFIVRVRKAEAKTVARLKNRLPRKFQLRALGRKKCSSVLPILMADDISNGFQCAHLLSKHFIIVSYYNV